MRQQHAQTAKNKERGAVGDTTGISSNPMKGGGVNSK
jgi:hypothetical protein